MKNTTKLIGKHVIVRSNLAGVFFGILIAKEKDELTLKDARKFYFFSGANTAEDLAVKGALNSENCKMTIEVEEIIISKFEQILLCTDAAIKQNKSIKVWSYKN
jgi:cysteine sulfinate desulfinase/cysteine desulfurase-like protein